MDIQSVTSTATEQSTKTKSLGKDEFLKILITQLKYQNPLEPLKPDEFLAQLSQLTQVEQLTNIATSVDDIKKGTEQGDIAAWLSTVGKKVGVEGSNTLSKGDQIVLKPQADFDEIILTFTDLSTGSMKEKRIAKGQDLTYTYEEEGNVGVVITPLKAGKLTSCQAQVYKVVRGVETGDSGVQVVLGDGTSLPVKMITKLKE
jgi:flagellar hook assembly protein FlgD